VLFEDVLSLVHGDTVIVKADIEGYECKARHFSAFNFYRYRKTRQMS
jgi:hypothetical protein